MHPIPVSGTQRLANATGSLVRIMLPFGALGWTRTNNFRVRNAVLFPLSYESNQTRGTNGICTHTAAVTMPDATFTTWSLEMVTRQGIEPCSPGWNVSLAVTRGNQFHQLPEEEVGLRMA